MRQWRVIFTFEVEEDLNELDKQIRERVLKKILWLRDNFNQIIPLPLGGKWQGFFKLRISDWRVIYDIEKSRREITIHRIALRSKVYKKRKKY